MTNKGFTLSEVLITLGVIGVVSALTLPSLIKNYQKHVTVNKLKKTYSVLNQAIRLSEAQNGEYNEWESAFSMGAEAYFNKYWKPYLNGAKLCKTYRECGYNRAQPWKGINGSGATAGIENSGGWRDVIAFYLSDGTFVVIGVGSGSLNNLHEDNSVAIDLNGTNLPNRYGRDVFFFNRDIKGRLVPEQNGGCSFDTKGDACANKIIKDGWKIKDDYPW